MAVELRTQRVRHIKRWWQGGYFRMDERPSAETDLVPLADSAHFYARDDSGVSALFYRDDAGVEHPWGGAGGGPGGGVAIGDTITGGTAGSILLIGAGPVLAQETVATLNATLDHGALLGLGDDDHSLYLLASDATSRVSFAANWLDLTDGGATTLHSHAGGVTDHGALTGLADDDHAQYALLAGRAGGQTEIGGTGVTDFLSLQSTGGVGTTDYIKFLVGNNGGTEAMRIIHSGFIGIGTSTPLTQLDLAQSSAGGTLYYIGLKNTSAGQGDWRIGIVSDDLAIFGRATNGEPTTINARFPYGGGLYLGTTLDRVGLLRIYPPIVTELGAQDSSALYIYNGVDNNSLGQIGFGYNVGRTYIPAYIAYLATTGSGYGYGPLVFGTRSVTTDTQPTQRMRISPQGNILIGATVDPSAGDAGLIFSDSTALATMASNTAGLYADSMGANVEMMSISESGSLRSLAWPRCVKVGTQFDKIDATLADITNLTHNVNAGKSYDFEALLHVDASLVGGSKFAIAGTATATSIIYHIDLLDNTTNAHTITSRQTALGGNAGQAGTTAGLCRIIGTIVVNAAGTLTVQMAQNAANGTSSVLVNSSFNVDQLP